MAPALPLRHPRPAPCRAVRTTPASSGPGGADAELRLVAPAIGSPAADTTHGEHTGEDCTVAADTVDELLVRHLPHTSTRVAVDDHLVNGRKPPARAAHRRPASTLVAGSRRPFRPGDPQ